MFGPPGVLYVYFTYGMHHCANVVAGTGSDASAVLMRAGEVVSGFDAARVRRPAARARDLARGPARLAKTLGLDLSQAGTDLTDATSAVWLAEGTPVPDEAVSVGPRVGIRSATERPWRLWVTDDQTVSPFRAAKALGQRPATG
jgi:DNA-3-methyladenine glycosylase